MDEEEVVVLNKNDIAALLEIKDLYIKQKDFENEELFFKGGSNAYYYFKKLGILDDGENKMKYFNESFSNLYHDHFAEYFSNVFVDLRENDKEYQELLSRKEEVLNKYPRLREVLENKHNYSLNSDEIQGLIEYLDIMGDKSIIEEITLMFRGMGEAYVLFKRINIIKD